MGTPDFAASALEALVQSRHEILAVVTQPDKPKGRKGILTPSPVKEIALREEIPVLQPKRVREEGFDEILAGYQADAFVVVAFGQIIPQRILDLPKYGCLNVHGSLLPSYRGAAPIQWAVLDGRKKSGVTVMQMDAGIDTGDILLQKEIVLAEDETAGSLFDRLSALGAEALLEVLDGLEAGTVTPVPQGESDTPYAKMLTKEMGEIDFSRSGAALDAFVRGMDPWPGAYTFLGEKMLKVWKLKPAGADRFQGAQARPVPGQVAEGPGFLVGCGDGAVELLEVQIEGKKRMAAADFLRGNVIPAGTMLGHPEHKGEPDGGK